MLSRYFVSVLSAAFSTFKSQRGHQRPQGKFQNLILLMSKSSDGANRALQGLQGITYTPVFVRHTWLGVKNPMCLGPEYLVCWSGIAREWKQAASLLPSSLLLLFDSFFPSSIPTLNNTYLHES